MSCADARVISVEPKCPGPFVQCCEQGPAAPFHDPVRGPDDPLCGQREIALGDRPFAIEIVRRLQEPKLAPICQAIGDDIHGPDQVRPPRHSRFLGLLQVPPSPRPDRQGRLLPAADPVDPLVVPGMPRHFVQEPETQAQTQVVRLRHRNRQVGDQVVFLVAGFLCRLNVLNSCMHRSKPIRRSRLSTKPVVCPSAMPNRTFIVGHA